MRIKDFKIGATGRFPEGEVDATDEGELQMALAADYQHAIVRVVFGKPIAWLGLPARQARELGYQLIQKANDLEKRKT